MMIINIELRHGTGNDAGRFYVVTALWIEHVRFESSPSYYGTRMAARMALRERAEFWRGSEHDVATHDYT